MLRTILLTCIIAFPVSAAAQDAAPATATMDAGVRTPKIKRKPKTIDFEDETDGPSAGEEVTTRNPDAVKHGSIFPDKYKRPAGANNTNTNKRGRGCAGCANTTHTTSAAALLLLALAVALRRH